MIFVTKNGYIVRTPAYNFPTMRLSRVGVMAVRTSDRNGDVVAAINPCESRDMLIVTKRGYSVRVKVGHIRETGRNCQGVRAIRLRGEDEVVAVTEIS